MKTCLTCPVDSVTQRTVVGYWGWTRGQWWRLHVGGSEENGDGHDNGGTGDGGVFNLYQDLRVEGKGGTWKRRWRWVCTVYAKRKTQYYR